MLYQTAALMSLRLAEAAAIRRDCRTAPSAAGGRGHSQAPGSRPTLSVRPKPPQAQAAALLVKLAAGKGRAVASAPAPGQAHGFAQGTEAARLPARRPGLAGRLAGASSAIPPRCIDAPVARPAWIYANRTWSRTSKQACLG